MINIYRCNRELYFVFYDGSRTFLVVISYLFSVSSLMEWSVLFRTPWCDTVHCYFSFYLRVSLFFCASLSGLVKGPTAINRKT
jgi:hypothetical protein